MISSPQIPKDTIATFLAKVNDYSAFTCTCSKSKNTSYLSTPTTYFLLHPAYHFSIMIFPSDISGFKISFVRVSFTPSNSQKSCKRYSLPASIWFKITSCCLLIFKPFLSSVFYRRFFHRPSLYFSKHHLHQLVRTVHTAILTYTAHILLHWQRHRHFLHL